MKKRYYILIAILSYLFFTLGSVPAAKVISLVEENTKLPVKLYGVHGSIWNGGAEKAMMKGQPPVDNIQWSINPTMLLLAQLSGEIKASIKNQNIVGNINISATGKLSASDIRARVEAAIIQELMQLPLGELDGVFNINIESLEIKEEGLPLITAKLKWKNAKLTLLDTVDLGFIDISIEPGENDQLIATISNKQGQLTLDGKTTLDSKSAYNASLRITPNASITESINESIKMLSKQKMAGRHIMKQQNDGSYLIKHKGNLHNLGL